MLLAENGLLNVLLVLGYNWWLLIDYLVGQVNYFECILFIFLLCIVLLFKVFMGIFSVFIDIGVVFLFFCVVEKHRFKLFALESYLFRIKNIPFWDLILFVIIFIMIGFVVSNYSWLTGVLFNQVGITNQIHNILIFFIFSFNFQRFLSIFVIFIKVSISYRIVVIPWFVVVRGIKIIVVETLVAVEIELFIVIWLEGWDWYVKIGWRKKKVIRRQSILLVAIQKPFFFHFLTFLVCTAGLAHQNSFIFIIIIWSSYLIVLI
jgi:hypothetical protein